MQKVIHLPDRIFPSDISFGGLLGGNGKPQFPKYLYREGDPPLKVMNAEEEEAARLEGYDAVHAGQLANKYLINWFWDLEDMSPKQLRVFALEEYGVDLPEEASQEKLFQAVVELTRAAPQNRNRLVLMAHTISMQYEETMEEIRRMVDNPMGAGLEEETITFEVML